MTSQTVSHRYHYLTNHFPLIPIENEAHLDEAIKVINELIDHNPMTGDERKYFDVLSMLVKKYKDESDPLPKMDPTDAIIVLLEQNNLTQYQLAKEAKISRTSLSEILNKHRKIGPEVAAKLGKRFNVNPDIFLTKKVIKI